MDELKVPDDIRQTLLKGLVFLNRHDYGERVNKAWKWVEDHSGNVEEMGN